MLFVEFLSVHFFFFKQKTAYEMRISDWSSDVCSSDLLPRLLGRQLHHRPDHLRRRRPHGPELHGAGEAVGGGDALSAATPMPQITVSFNEALAAVVAALKAAGASPEHAAASARALVTAEAEIGRAHV